MDKNQEQFNENRGLDSVCHYVFTISFFIEPVTINIELRNWE